MRTRKTTLSTTLLGSHNLAPPRQAVAVRQPGDLPTSCPGSIAIQASRLGKDNRYDSTIGKCQFLAKPQSIQIHIAC